ncbi:MAG: 30S ribosomal protein S7 [archaeon]|nr:30S ribosomal protein S7 [archaeon]
MKLFNLYDCDEIVVNDPGLKRVINVTPKIMLKSHGKAKGKFSKTKVNIVERLANLLGVPGHRNKKHKIMTSLASGKFTKNMKVVLAAFKIIEEKTKQNPVQVFVTAVEKASPREEVTIIEYGGAKYPQAVDCSPSRRISLTLRLMVHGAYDKAFGKKTKIEDALANEIILAFQDSGDSAAAQKKNEMEKQANSAR